MTTDTGPEKWCRLTPLTPEEQALCTGRWVHECELLADTRSSVLSSYRCDGIPGGPIAARDTSWGLHQRTCSDWGRFGGTVWAWLY